MTDITGFGKKDVLEMYTELAEWLGLQQIGYERHPHYGAIFFPSEDRYCNRDTACAVVVFMRMNKLTGESVWLEKAKHAFDYVLSVQRENGGYPELRGQADSDGGSAVNTSIIADNLITAFDLGLQFGDNTFDALERMADFELTLEWKPGAFYHDTNHILPFYTASGEVRWGAEGSKIDCHNTTALSAMMLLRISDFFKRNDRQPKSEWYDAAVRAVKHLLGEQNPDGHFPYKAGADWFDMNHHGMVMFHLAETMEFLPDEESAPVLDVLQKAARWQIETGLLHTQKGSKPDWAIQRSACIYFSWGYFVIAAPLARMANLDKENTELWQRNALELLRYVRTSLWNNPEMEKEGPMRLIEGDIRKGYAWFGQSMGWCLYQLGDLITQLNWW